MQARTQWWSGRTALFTGVGGEHTKNTDAALQGAGNRRGPLGHRKQERPSRATGTQEQERPSTGSSGTGARWKALILSISVEMSFPCHFTQLHIVLLISFLKWKKIFQCGTSAQPSDSKVHDASDKKSLEFWWFRPLDWTLTTMSMTCFRDLSREGLKAYLRVVSDKFLASVVDHLLRQQWHGTYPTPDRCWCSICCDADHRCQVRFVCIESATQPRKCS